MFEATKNLIEHCKHLPITSRVFSDELVKLAEKEIQQFEASQQIENKKKDHNHNFNNGLHCSICGKSEF